MFNKFKRLLCAVVVTFLLVASANAAQNSAESTALLEKANDLYYNKSDDTASYTIYQQAADKGNVLAKAQIAKMLYLSAGVAEDKPKAQKLFRQVRSHLESLAKQGNAFAQYMYGNYWDLGFTGSKSATKAHHWYQKAAEKGCTPAQNNLANQYINGEGVAEDHGKGLYWYQQAAEQGNITAQTNLASQYLYGKDTQDYAKAAHWYRKAAGQGNSTAQYELGLLYYYGKGVREDNDNALFWLKEASKQNHGDAQKFIGIMYESGYGVKKDYDMAEKLYKIALANGSTGAQKKLTALQEKRRQENIKFTQYIHGMAKEAKEQEELKAKEDEQVKVNLRKIRDFEFPDTICSRPSLPGVTQCTSSRINRLNKALIKWRSCLDSANRKDRKAFKKLVVEVGGTVKENGDGSYSWSVRRSCQCYDELKDVDKRMDSRREERFNRDEEMDADIDNLERRIDKHNFWENINKSFR